MLLVFQKIKSRVPSLVPLKLSNCTFHFLPPLISHPSWSLDMSVEYKPYFLFFFWTFVLATRTVWVIFFFFPTFEFRGLFPTLILTAFTFYKYCFFFFATSYIYLCFVLPSDCLLLETVTLFYILSEFNKQLLRMNYEPGHMLDALDKEIQSYGILLKDLPICLSHIVSRTMVLIQQVLSKHT